MAVQCGLIKKPINEMQITLFGGDRCEFSARLEGASSSSCMPLLSYHFFADGADK